MARASDINKAIETTVAKAVRTELSGEIRRLERQMTRLAEQLKSLTRTAARVSQGASVPIRPPSPGRRLHGRYIGLLRHLPKKAQSQVRGIRHRQGVQAAIAAAERLRK